MRGEGRRGLQAAPAQSLLKGPFVAWIDSSSALFTYLDARMVARLATDTDTPADPVPIGAGEESLIVNHLVRARNTIEDAISVGARYSVPLDDAEVSQGIIWIQAMLTAESLFARRGYDELPESLKAQIDRSYAQIDEIRKGGRIPGLIDEAGANATVLPKLGTLKQDSITSLEIGYFS